MKQRFEITGEWSGPNSPAGDYTRICHREVTTDRRLALFCAGTHGIRFTDGTMLYLAQRPFAKGERVKKQPILGYSKLIRDCARFGVDSVDALVAAQKAEKYMTGAPQ